MSNNITLNSTFTNLFSGEKGAVALAFVSDGPGLVTVVVTLYLPQQCQLSFPLSIGQVRSLIETLLDTQQPAEVINAMLEQEREATVQKVRKWRKQWQTYYQTGEKPRQDGQQGPSDDEARGLVSPV